MLNVLLFLQRQDDFALLLGLICPRGRCVSGHVTPRSSRKHHRDALTKKTRKRLTDSSEVVAVPLSYLVGKQGKKLATNLH